MNGIGKFVCAGFFALTVGTGSLGAGAAEQALPADNDQLLKQADGLRTSDYSRFSELLKRLSADSAHLDFRQQTYLRYLKGWDQAYRGDFEVSVTTLDQIIDQSDDVVLRFRAGVSVVNILALGTRYEEAYRRLAQVMDLLPRISDGDARQQSLIVAGLLYNQVGQYDLTFNAANTVSAENWSGKGICKGAEIRLEALFKSERFDAFDQEFQQGIDACVEAKEVIWANLIRSFAARRDIKIHRYDTAVTLLTASYPEVESTKFTPLIVRFNSALARAHREIGDFDAAKKYATRAIEANVTGQLAEPLADAFMVLYEVAKQQGDFDNALAYHEKYAAADKGYLNDTSARTLAFQMVNQQVLDKKRQIDALNEKNQRLQLQQQVDSKTAETARLYIALLIVVLAFIGFWAYKTKRSQLRFMRLARRDGLTGIFNRQHFIDAATDQLRYCGKSARDACVIVVDLDHFKSVNDVYGHATGDLVLKRAVKSCEDRLRSIDIFGRLGGEEFGIVLPDCAIEQALVCAEDLRQAIADVSGSDARIDFPVSATFGVAATHTSGYDLRELLANADTALYEGKREGRNRVAAYHASAAARSVEAAARAARAL